MIDIIIPVYNTPIEDIKRCLDSIINQTYKNYQVYIIDDGSKKEIAIFLDSYTKEWNNFKVVHIKNSGVSHARNVGIELSKNKYITFIDSDDSFEKDFLKEALYLIEHNNLDLIIGGYNEIVHNEIVRTRQSQKGLHIYEKDTLVLFFKKLLSGKTEEQNQELGDCPTGRIYTRLFKRSTMKELRFDTKINISEDTLFMIDYMKKANKIGVVDNIWYNYYKNPYSISNGTKKEKLRGYILKFIKEIKKRQDEEQNPVIKESYQERIKKAKSYMDTIV